MAATTQEKPATTTTTSAPEYVTRNVGPLKCRFVADRALPDGKRPPHVPAVPTVESLATEAWKFVRIIDGLHNADSVDERVKVITAAKASRGCAESAVKVAHLKDPKGQLHTKAALAPLVTVVRKAFVASVREWGRERKVEDRKRAVEQARADREAARQRERNARDAARARAGAEAKASRLARCAVLPEGAKPSRALADKTAHVEQFRSAQLVREGNDWQLIATDGYQVCVFPLDVHGQAGLVEGLIPGEAVRAIEKSRGFRIERGMIVPMTFTRSPQAVRRPGPLHTYDTHYLPIAAPAGSTRYALDTSSKPQRINDSGRKDRPRKDQKPALMMRPRPAASKRMSLTLNAAMLDTIAAALGATHGSVTIEFDADCFNKADDGSRRWATGSKQGKHGLVSPAIRVRGLGRGEARAFLMPVAAHQS